MQAVVVGVLAVLVLVGGWVATVWLYERRLEREQRASLLLFDRLQADLERSRGENTTLLRQIAGIDPTPEQLRADMLEQLQAGGKADVARVLQQPIPAGPVPHEPTRFEFPAEDYDDDPTDLTQPLDFIPENVGDDAFVPWAGIEAPGLAWAPDSPLPAPEPVPEGEHRPLIVAMSPDENPLEELGITPAWREQ